MAESSPIPKLLGARCTKPGRPADFRPEAIRAVNTHADLAAIIEAMRDGLTEHPDEWENHTLECFLDALAALTDALPTCSPTAANHCPTSHVAAGRRHTRGCHGLRVIFGRRRHNI